MKVPRPPYCVICNKPGGTPMSTALKFLGYTVVKGSRAHSGCIRINPKKNLLTLGKNRPK